ncbi:hypothetical protein ABZP36_005066 [Zizania latifolia]
MIAKSCLYIFLQTIPDEFVQHFRGEIPRTINLQSRNGCIFDVQITKNLGKLSLQSGWKAFVSAHDLEVGDFLVFKYDGISKFKVQIFGPSCCEKMPSCLTLKSTTHGGNRSEEPLVISSSFHDLCVKSNDIINIGDVAPQECDLEVNSVPSYILPIRNRLTATQEEQLENKVRAICSEIPIFVCILRKSSIHGKVCSVDIVREYASVYLPFEERALTLQRHGKNWEVQWRLMKRRSKRISKGWRRFVHDNNLHVGDICLFELLKTKECIMKVHIIHSK